MTQTENEVPTAEVVASENGRLTIPAHVRRAAGIEPGQRLVVYVEDGRVMIEGQSQLAARIRRDVLACWTGTGSAVDELISERRAESAAEETEGTS